MSHSDVSTRTASRGREGAAPFSAASDPVLSSVALWLAEISPDIPEAVQARGSLAVIAWVAGPPLDTPTTVAPRF